jgi:hypothetical protein
MRKISTISTISSWYSIWKDSPSGAMLIAGYDYNTTGLPYTGLPYNCITNYGSKVKIIGPGRSVKSLIYNKTPYTDESFSCSSAASAVMTGVIASALSKNTSLTEGQIKNALYDHPTSITVIVLPPTRSRTPTYTMKVPNVTTFYNQLALYP